MIRFLRSRMIHDGETRLYRFTFRAKSWAEAEEFRRENFPPTHCQHEYDCCGNWYLEHSTVQRAHNRRNYIITVWMYRNI